MVSSVRKVVSGGQTGVDRAALDVAIYLGLEHGGWCPKGRMAEDGRIPDVYRLNETESFEYSERTERNVVDSDGTLVMYWSELSGGTLLTERLAKKHARPCLAIDLAESSDSSAASNWLIENKIQVLNVAGPRASTSPQAVPAAEHFLLRLLDA